MGFFEKIKNGLKKTRAAMANTLGGIFASFSGANEEFYEELEESMILADIGVETSCKAVEQLRTVVKERKLRTAEGPKRMDCASGFGAATMVTASFGFGAVSHALKKMMAKAERQA